MSRFSYPNNLMTTRLSHPNLFNYATSELSQDAFICWLAAWADPQWQDADPALHQAGQDFIASMIRKVRPDYDAVSLKSVDIKRQADKLDVLIEVNKAMPDKLAILVEDKTHTSNHSDQLNRYHAQIREVGYDESEMIPLYFKTGYQSRFDTLGFFKTYLRSDFLDVLRLGKGKGVQNAIFNDFLAHLEQMDAATRQFSNKVFKWDHLDWQGFFMTLYDKRLTRSKIGIDDNWGYVANPSGGFFGYWWYFKIVPGNSYMPYLQLEEECLVFKIEVKNEADDRRVVRDDAHQRIMDAASRLSISVGRPERMGNGRFTTVARWTGEYRVFSDGKLDFDATLANLEKAQQILDTAFDDKQPVQPL